LCLALVPSYARATRGERSLAECSGVLYAGHISSVFFPCSPGACFPCGRVSLVAVFLPCFPVAVFPPWPMTLPCFPCVSPVALFPPWRCFPLAVFPLCPCSAGAGPHLRGTTSTTGRRPSALPGTRHFTVRIQLPLHLTTSGQAVYHKGYRCTRRVTSFEWRPLTPFVPPSNLRVTAVA